MTKGVVSLGGYFPRGHVGKVGKKSLNLATCLVIKDGQETFVLFV